MPPRDRPAAMHGEAVMVGFVIVCIPERYSGIAWRIWKGGPCHCQVASKGVGAGPTEHYFSRLVAPVRLSRANCR